MEEFYQYVYANTLPLFILTIGLSVVGVMMSRRGKIRLGRKLSLAAIGGDFLLSSIYLVSFFFVQHANDLLFALLWGGLGYWNYRKCKTQ